MLILNHSGRPHLRIRSPPAYHLTCRQLTQLQMDPNGVLLHNAPVDKLILVVRIIDARKGTSPRGLPVTFLHLEDSTGRCRVTLYDQNVEKGDYYKMTVSARISGPVYKQEIKLQSFGIVPLHHYSDLTEHFLECMKSQLLLTSI